MEEEEEEEEQQQQQQVRAGGGQHEKSTLPYSSTSIFHECGILFVVATIYRREILLLFTTVINLHPIHTCLGMKYMSLVIKMLSFNKLLASVHASHKAYKGAMETRVEEIVAMKSVMTTQQAAQKSRKEALLAQEVFDRFGEENESTYVSSTRYWGIMILAAS